MMGFHIPEGEVLYRPDPARVAASRLSAFARSLGREVADVPSYESLWEYSVNDLDGFWARVWDFFEVEGVREPGAPSVRWSDAEHAEWFPGATCNYAANVFRPSNQTARPSVIGVSEGGGALRERSFGELEEEVRRVAELLADLGVTQGDRVAGYAPNTPETLVAFLATASLGAIWSCCSPEFAPSAVVDRFSQISPKVLIAVTSYTYGGRRFDRRDAVADVIRALEDCEAMIVIGEEPSTDERATAGEPSEHILDWNGTIVRFDEDRTLGRPLTFAAVPFSHPLWILYSSGTTGKPKAIVQSHGGIVLEHLKAVGLQGDLGPGSRFLWFSTTGWMMWNFLIGGLLCGSDIVVYDGAVNTPDLYVLWDVCERAGVTMLGISAPLITTYRKAGIRPRDRFALTQLRTIGSTGAPLDLAGFAWIYDSVSPTVDLVSASGGTDVCTAFLGSSPCHPVRAGRLAARGLGAKVEVFREDGSSTKGEVGELVITAPMPSMPIFFWGDEDGSRLHDAYFAEFPGVWRHGDFLCLYEDGSSVIYGRSDSTLNRGGIRAGTAEFYRVIEGLDGVGDAVVVDTTALGKEGEIWCFVTLRSPDEDVAALAESIRRAIRTELSPRHVPDRVVVVDEIPRTLNGKKLEVPLRRILLGSDPSSVVQLEAVANPEAFRSVVAAIRQSTQQEGK
jgi:acetoacetyl-CoA synthetase